LAITTITEARLSPASEQLRETVRSESCPFWERVVWAADAFRETEGQPFRGLRVARATERILARMPIRIRRGELLVGWHPSTRADEALQRRIDEANRYLGTQSYWLSASEGHMAPDYPAILALGVDGLRRRIDELEQALAPTDRDAPEKRGFYDAARVSLEAFQQLIRRYVALAREMAEGETDAEWRDELLEIASICEHVAQGPARTLREALQFAWFMFLAVAIEAGPTHHCFGPGRLDQWLWPYYEADLEAGRIDEAQVDELLDQFFIKCNEFDAVLSMSALIMVVAGRKPDGSDATNELSFKMLEAADRVRMYFPGVDISWHRDIDSEFMQRAVTLLRNGKGQPSFFNDEVIVRGLERVGVPFQHAIDHLPSTCTETSIAGRCNPWVAWPYMNLAMDLLYALFGGKHPASGNQDRPAFPVPQTYDELKARFHEQLEITAHNAIAQGLKDQLLEEWHRPFPLLSCFVDGCLERGTDISSGGARYNFLQPEAVGVSNVVDGLAAVNTLVEDGKRFTLDDFRAAIRANFEGHADLRRAIIRDCPKYGNDDPWINDLFAEVAGGWCTYLEGHTNRFGGPVLPGFLGWVVWIDYGRQTPATPDGRLSGVPLANSLAPCTGVQPKGYPSLILSASKLDHSRGLGGMTFNLRFGGNALVADGGVDRLRALVEAAMDLGTYMVQITVVSAETLRAAQEAPQDYQDLFVRIGGYLVPFVLLPEDAQSEVIARTELEL
jgi:choline trimethylamine-lyase